MISVFPGSAGWAKGCLGNYFFLYLQSRARGRGEVKA